MRTKYSIVSNYLHTHCVSPKFQRVLLRNMLKGNRYVVVSKRTGCLVPCERTTYRLKEVLRYSAVDYLGDIGHEIYQTDENTTMMVIRLHTLAEVTRHTEVLAYGPGEFVSDIGGLSGLFLGLSLWSIWNNAKKLLTDND